MDTKKKGTVAERELLKLFWDSGWAALRTPGSGSAKHPSPDIIAGNVSRRIVMECKVCKENYKYIENEEIEQLLLFANKFGAEPWVGARFSKQEWLFMTIEDLMKTKKNHCIRLEQARLKGLSFEELVEN